MSRKDFQLIAGVIANLSMDGEAKERVARAFAFELSGTNEQFKSDLFIQAATGVVAVTARKARTA